jgi:hypothetical protein
MLLGMRGDSRWFLPSVSKSKRVKVE